jgi:ComF family protein
LYAYEPPLRDAIRLFKYHGKVSLADAFGALLGQALPALPECDFVMAVPLHPTRLREREFNQSLLLADRLAPRLRKPVAVGTLIRTRATEPQTELTRSARRANLRRAFAVPHPEEVTDKRILLVDDVMTTGTTVNECAKALRRAGSSDVYVLTLARTI